MEAKLVFIFMNSKGPSFPGIWNTNPGDRNANSAAAIRGAAQSFIILLPFKAQESSQAYIFIYLHKRKEKKSFQAMEEGIGFIPIKLKISITNLILLSAISELLVSSRCQGPKGRNYVNFSSNYPIFSIENYNN